MGFFNLLMMMMMRMMMMIYNHEIMIIPNSQYQNSWIESHNDDNPLYIGNRACLAATALPSKITHSEVPGPGGPHCLPGK